MTNGYACVACTSSQRRKCSLTKCSLLLLPSQSPSFGRNHFSYVIHLWLFLAFSRIADVRKYAVCILLCLASFAQCKVCKFHPCCSMDRHFVPFPSCVVFEETVWVGLVAQWCHQGSRLLSANLTMSELSFFMDTCFVLSPQHRKHKKGKA